MRRLLPICLLLTVFIAAGCSRPGTPSAPDLPRWKLYERALADILLGPPGRTLPDLNRDHGLCEWVLLGQEADQVYVYALCQVEDLSIGTATSAPAVVHLGEGGNIAKVVMPDEGGGNVADLFPAAILAGISDAAAAGLADAMDHIDLRRHDPSIPPQIVLDGVQLP